MLIDAVGHVDLQSFPGEVVVEVPYRVDWELEHGYATDPTHGQEGVWYLRPGAETPLHPRQREWPHLYHLVPTSDDCDHLWVVYFWDRIGLCRFMRTRTVKLQSYDTDEGKRWRIKIDDAPTFGGFELT